MPAVPLLPGCFSMAAWHPRSFSGEQLSLSSSLLAGGSSALFTGPRGMRGLPGVKGCGVGREECHSADDATCALALGGLAPQQNWVGRW